MNEASGRPSSLKYTISIKAAVFLAAAFAALLCCLPAKADEASDSVATAPTLIKETPEKTDSTDHRDHPGDIGLEILDDIFPIKDQDPTPQESRNWWYLLHKGKLSLSDTTVVYPKFLKFCVDVYNGASRFFNTYDTTYVEGTGKRWKARLVNEGWADSYNMRFKKDGIRINMLSDMNDNLGAYIQFMAVSVGYSLDLSTLVRGKRNSHYRFETNFSCALFDFYLSYTRNAGTNIRQFSGYNDDHLIKYSFPGARLYDLEADLYYFFNHKRYSQGAAYSFSRYQLRSAGSWMLGLTFNNLDIHMDFGTLAEDLKPHYTFPEDYLRLHYRSYCLLFGYGYNWVWHPKWLFNITAMPSLGVNRTYEDTTAGSGTQFALNILGRIGLTFNHRALFAGIAGRFTGNFYTSDSLSLFNAVEHFAATVGVRF